MRMQAVQEAPGEQTSPGEQRSNVLSFAEWGSRVKLKRDEKRLVREREEAINLLLREFKL